MYMCESNNDIRKKISYIMMVIMNGLFLKIQAMHMHLAQELKSNLVHITV